MTIKRSKERRRTPRTIWVTFFPDGEIWSVERRKPKAEKLDRLAGEYMVPYVMRPVRR